ncbi:MAG: hypothetical protein QME78_00255 [Thermodesulfobacteriota bacterium]|nr:hypothetical protein [Thermodesulfobacteriota bacterium]
MSSPLREEIMRRTDLAAVFQKYGGRIPDRNRISADGWLEVHSVDRNDKKPSAAINVGSDPRFRGIYVDKGAIGHGKFSFFDLLARIPGSPFITGRDAYERLGRESGVFTGEGGRKQPDRPKPTLTDVEAFQKNLTPETLQFLKEKRGLTEESLAKFRIGWCTKRERNSIPVFDATAMGSSLVNIRFHNSKKEPKTLNWSGHGEARLWGLERLAKAPAGTVIITEGEFDAMLAEQETGMIGVSSTNGAKGFKADWVKHFHGHHVVLLYDSDSQGREAVHSLVLPAFEAAVEAGQVLSIKVVWLYDLPVDKSHKDLTDWIIKDGGSGARLKELISQAALHTYPKPVSHLEPPIPLDSFEQIDRAEYAGKRVTVPLQVYGENTVAYHAVTKVKVTSCPALRDGKCAGLTGPDGKTLIRSCLQEIDIPLGERVMISGVRATEGQLQKHLRDYVCDKDRRPALLYKDEDRLTIREVYAHQTVGAMAPERLELVEKPIYIIGGALVEIGKYQAAGRVLTAYRDQQPTMLVDTLERLEEDYQGFTVEKYRLSLEKLREMDPSYIAADLAVHVTRIYERPDLHLGVLLVLCSPLWFDFPGEDIIRGWLTAIIVGDTGTGKTTVSEGLFNFAGVGSRVSGMTASRTGITYGCEHDERRGWRIKAGALLKMTRQALIVDEAQDIARDELKTMAEGIDTGLVRIDKIQNKVFESRTRVLFGNNPIHPKQAAEQRTMDSFRYGCEAIKGVYPQMMIRRIDFAMFSATWDIEDKEKIFYPEQPDGPQQVTAENLRALIFYAWNLKPEQIIIDDNTAHYIRKTAKYLSDRFGGSDDLPIVYSEDFRKTMARLSVAYAVLDLSTTEDFGQVIVEPQHVAMVCDLLERIYGARNCKLDKYAKNYRFAHGLQGVEKIVAEINAKLSGELGPKHRFHHIFYELLKCPDGARVRKTDLADEFDVEPKTIQNDMRFFRDNHLIDSNVQKGYRPEPRLFQVWDFLERLDPKKFCFEKNWREAYSK